MENLLLYYLYKHRQTYLIHCLTSCKQDTLKKLDTNLMYDTPLIIDKCINKIKKKQIDNILVYYLIQYIVKCESMTNKIQAKMIQDYYDIYDTYKLYHIFFITKKN